MKLVILTEGFSHTGYGHIVRCMAIARYFRLRGVAVTFCLNGDQQGIDLLHEYPVVSLNWMENPEPLRTLLQQHPIALVDSYLAGVEVYEQIYREVSLAVYLDDYNRIQYPPGIILNGTVGAELIHYPAIQGQRLLLGKEYLLLRETFRDIPPERSFPNRPQTLLITFGGSDILGLTATILSKLTKTYPNIQKTVILGAAFKQHREVEALADGCTEIHRNVDAKTMKRLMLCADLAISAAGQTMNELAATGLPSIIFKVAENQTNNIKGWMQEGFISGYVDATANWKETELEECLAKLADPASRKAVSERGKALVDGLGGERLAKTVLHTYASQNLIAAQAGEEDMQSLFELANDEVVRQNSFSTQPIPWESHVAWFKASLMNKNRLLYRFSVNRLLVGQVRLDRDEGAEVATISISLTAHFRGLGLAPQLFQQAVAKLKREQPHFCKCIQAYVKPENNASRNALVKAGYAECVSDENEYLKYVIAC